ncbi:MAG: PAS domain-containing protein [Streptosporangiaceae bacterium]
MGGEEASRRADGLNRRVQRAGRTAQAARGQSAVLQAESAVAAESAARARERAAATRSLLAGPSRRRATREALRGGPAARPAAPVAGQVPAGERAARLRDFSLTGSRPRRAQARPVPRPAAAAVSWTALAQLVGIFTDGVALTDQAGMILLASAPLADMFGYRRDELAGRPVERLIPVDLSAARERRPGSRRPAAVRLMDAQARLVGLRKDGTTIPVGISLSPVSTSAGLLTMVVVREMPAPAQPGAEEPAAGAWPEEPGGHEMLDRIVARLFQAGLSLQGAIGAADSAAGDGITKALALLDETIREVREHVFQAGDDDQRQPRPAAPDAEL